MSVRLLHVGRKVPKGYRELPGAMHLGGGVWLLPMEPVTAPEDGMRPKAVVPDTAETTRRGPK